MASSMERRVHVLGRRQRLATFSLVLLRCFLGVQSNAVDWNSLNDDLLLPYAPPRHGPQRHHRGIRDCQALLSSNTTHVSWPGDNSRISPLAITKSFVSYFPRKGQDSRPVYGHLTVARDPLRTFSVLEPGGPGGCRSNRTGTVEEAARRGKCLVAQNGGYFNMETGECFGNVVSNGQMVQTSGGVQNAQFGIRKDGTLVFGYLSEEEVLAKENPFVQLVSGVIWLLRDGEVYVNESRQVECEEMQKTGTFDKFINTVSARTAVGHDRQGQLVLMHVDGQTDARGLNLWEMADFLKQQGVVNAINLDGGGSATLVLNGTLASYPSDHCAFDPMWRCPRRISTVVCVHEPACQHPECSGHGRCVLGQCHCNGAFWSGPACNVLDCGPSNCTLHGMCTEAGCLCDAGWMGTNCSEVCTRGSYGDGCAQKCCCHNGGTCNSVNGSCDCVAGFRGTFCEEGEQYGKHCQHACQCPNQCPCDQKTGSCNVSSESPMMAGQCLLKANHESLFTGKIWSVRCAVVLVLVLVLAVLLLISVVVHMKPHCCPAGRRGQGGPTYHLLEEMNGETTHMEGARD